MGDSNGESFEENKRKQLTDHIMPLTDQNQIPHAQETTHQDSDVMQSTDTGVTQTHCPNSTIKTNTQTPILASPEVLNSTLQVKGNPPATSQHTLYPEENHDSGSQLDQQHLAAIKPTESQQQSQNENKNTQAPAENQQQAITHESHPQHHKQQPLKTPADDNTTLKFQSSLSESPHEKEILVSSPENQNSETRPLANPNTTDDIIHTPDEETIKIIKEEFQNGLDFSFNQYQEIMNKLIDTPAQPLTESQIIQYHNKTSAIILQAYEETYPSLLDLNHESVQTLFDEKYKKLKSTIRKQQAFYKRKHEITTQKVTAKIKDCTFEAFGLYDELMAKFDLNTNPPTEKTFLEDHQKFVNQVVGKFDEAVSSKGLEVANFWRYELNHKFNETKEQFLQRLSEKSQSEIERQGNEENSVVHTETSVHTTFEKAETETLDLEPGDSTSETTTDKISKSGSTPTSIKFNEQCGFCQEGPSSDGRKFEIPASDNTNNTAEGNALCPSQETLKTGDPELGENRRQNTADKISTSGSTPISVNANEKSSFRQEGPSSESRKSEISASANTNTSNTTTGNAFCRDQDNMNADKATTQELSNKTENSDDKSPILKKDDGRQLFGNQKQSSQVPVQADAQQT